MPFGDNAWYDGQHESLPADEVLAASPGFWAIVIRDFDILEAPWSYATSRALQDLDATFDYNII